MPDAQYAKRTETDRTQAPLQKSIRMKQPIQRTANPTDMPLYVQAMGNHLPPWLRLSSRQQTPKEGEALQGRFESPRSRANASGLPDTLKAGIEGLSGLPMDDVHVHYHSSEPAKLGALAFTKGTEIHVGPGQEQHLAHEAWHVVQQKQGKVKPSLQSAGVSINDDPALEREADMMGNSAKQAGSGTVSQMKAAANQDGSATIQCYSLKKGWKISDNDYYMIDPARPEELHVLVGRPAPHPIDKFTHIRTSNGYEVYKFSGQFENDCLGFAEYLSTGEYSAKKSAFRSKGDRTGKTERLFGVSDEQNIDIAEALSSFSQAEEANPDIGEAFVTIRRELEPKKCPYHVAYIVANDGNDRVTCEGDAGSSLGAPVFDMYAVPPKKKGKKKTSVVAFSKSFHGTYEDSYRTKRQKLEPTTGVLTPRDVI